LLHFFSQLVKSPDQIKSDMRYTILVLVILVFACKNNEPTGTTTNTDTPNVIAETLQVAKEAEPEPMLSKAYANERFRDVTVERIGLDSFIVRGQGQIFEANFSWIVEDGHDELKKGFQMTDAGAPEWGKFEFSVRVQKRRENSTLMLVLFESSPRDGSRQYELPIPLY